MDREDCKTPLIFGEEDLGDTLPEDDIQFAWANGHELGGADKHRTNSRTVGKFPSQTGEHASLGGQLAMLTCTPALCALGNRILYPNCMPSNVHL
jgi:hypothetical protein